MMHHTDDELQQGNTNSRTRSIRNKRDAIDGKVNKKFEAALEGRLWFEAVLEGRLLEDVG